MYVSHDKAAELSFGSNLSGLVGVKAFALPFTALRGAFLSDHSNEVAFSSSKTLAAFHWYCWLELAFWFATPDGCLEI